MAAFNESAPTTTAPPGEDYYGRTFHYLPKPDEALLAGYNRIKVFKRNNPADPVWVELTSAAAGNRLVIESGKVNYVFVDPKAQRGTQYRAYLADSTNVNPDVPQPFIQEAVDTAYEAVMTTSELRDLYMWGLLGLFQDENGVQFPERLYVHYIQYGIAKFQMKTRIRVLPTPIQGEKHDFEPESFRNRYLSLLLDEFPCVSVDKITLLMPGQQPFVLPDSWLRKDLALGVVDVVPDTDVILPGLVPALRGSFGSPKVTPQAISVDYVAGFPLGKLPPNIKDVIGKEAQSGPLNIGGDLVGGAAIASQSMSIDGLSQSVNTTSSPTMGGFGARLIQANNELKRDYPIIEKLFKGPRLYVG